MGESDYNPQSTLLSHLYPAIPTNHFWDSQFALPGEGIAGEKCGQTKIVRRCSAFPEEHPVILIPHDCRSPTCPICWPRWCKRATNRATEKIWESLELAKKVIDKGFMVSGVVISPPEELKDLSYDDLQEQFRRVSKKLKAAGIAATLHLWRYRNDTGEILEAVPWREYEAHPTDFVRIRSPHWHCWVMGIMIDSDIFFEKTGWIYKKFRSETTQSWGLARNDIWNSVYYALSHTAVSISSTLKRHAMRYYGLLWRSRVKEELIDFEPIVCSVCGSPMEDTQVYDNDSYELNCNGLTTPSVKRIVTRLWEFRPKRSHQSKHRRGGGQCECMSPGGAEL
jgi:hypothetical protein